MNRDSGYWERVRPLFHLLLAAVPLAFLGCGMSGDAGDARAPSADDHWRIVQAYIDMDAAWNEKDGEIRRAEDGDEEKERRRRGERGKRPDIMLAVTAARAVVQAGGERAVDAASFLVQDSQGRSTTEKEDVEFGMAALKSLVGPDWSVVEALNARQADWLKRINDINGADIPRDEKNVRLAAAGSAPQDAAATAAALLIVELGPAHDRSREAAGFLIKRAVRVAAPDNALKAVAALAEHFPDYDGWENVLSSMAWLSQFDQSGGVGAFIAEMAASASDPVVRATARYFAATGLMVELNRSSVGPEERDRMHAKALEYATGLSLGVEDEEFVTKVTVDGEWVARTLAETEASLVHGLRHATAGGVLADETGRRLDGSEEKLSAYAGKVLLLDFWATWCGPCVAVLPELRELAAAHPKDRFEILMISVDAEAETVAEFMEDEPMPWAHWHVDMYGELARRWQIGSYPTYVVVDADGRILSRGLPLNESRALIEQALGEAPPVASTAPDA